MTREIGLAAAQKRVSEAREAGTLVRAVRIKNFRGIAEGELDGLTGITVLVGRNNTGKSTVLEALYLAATGCDYDSFGRNPLEYVVKRRGWFGIHSVTWLFFMEEEECSITIVFDTPSERTLSLRRVAIDVSLLSFLERQGLDVAGPIAYITSSTEGNFIRKYGHSFDAKGRYVRVGLAEKGGEPINALLLDWELAASFGHPEGCYSLMMGSGGTAAKELVLAVLGPRYGIKDIEPLMLSEESPELGRVRWALHVIYPNYAIPVYLLGDGLRLTLTYLMLLSTASNALLLLEEPELHQHPGLLELIADAIIRSRAQRGCQVVVSTHNLELIDLLLEKASELGVLDDITVYRLELKEGKLSSVRYSAQEAKELREELRYDLRR